MIRVCVYVCLNTWIWRKNNKQKISEKICLSFKSYKPKNISIQFKNKYKKINKGEGHMMFIKSTTLSSHQSYSLEELKGMIILPILTYPCTLCLKTKHAFN